MSGDLEREGRADRPLPLSLSWDSYKTDSRYIVSPQAPLRSQLPVIMVLSLELPRVMST